MASLSRPLEFAVVLYAGCLFGGPYRAARRIAARQGKVLRIDIQPSSKATAQACVDQNSWYFGELYRNM